MRVTESMLYQTTVGALSQNVERLQKIAQQVSTTKRLNKPSDDPADARSAVKLRDGLAELNQFVRNIDAAMRWASATDTALGSAGDAIQRANELAIEGANATLTANDRQAIAKEVEQLAASLIQDASAKAGDQYIFSGFTVDQAPYALTGAATAGPYQGDHGVLLSRIGPDSTMQVNQTADAVFGPAIAALHALYTDLTAGTPVQTGTIGGLQSALQAILDARAVAGSRMNRLEQTKSAQESLILDSRALLSQFEDVDMAQAITELSERQTTYDAALKVNARVMQNTLLDFLR